MHGTLYRRVADTAAWVYYIEHTVSRAYARYKKLFCSWSCNRPNHVLYYFMWGYGMTFEKKSAATVK
jgi:hypothetical protein